MLIGISSSVLYIYYLQMVKNKVIHTIQFFFFYHTRPEARVQFDAKK